MQRSNVREVDVPKCGCQRQRTERCLAGQTDGGNEVLSEIGGNFRSTRFRKLLRRYRPDVLPQLINVVRSDMSLVGRRPSLPTEASDTASTCAAASGQAQHHRVVPGQWPLRLLRK